MGDNRSFFASKMTVTMLVAVLVAFVAVSVDQVAGHVALTFPPARKYDLDFLDNSRTKGPCGMPRGEWRKNKRWVVRLQFQLTIFIIMIIIENNSRGEEDRDEARKKRQNKKRYLKSDWRME